VEVESYVEKELAYSKQIKTETLRIKANADALLAKAEAVKIGAKTIKLAAQKEAEQIINKGKSDAEIIKETAKKEADKITQNAESQAQEIKDKAWVEAEDIEKAAREHTVSIIDSAKGFIDTMLEKVLELPGGESLVKWARTFLKSVTKQDTKSAGTMEKGRKKTKTRD
jgi:cell division septum initiation protein DivIVA